MEASVGSLPCLTGTVLYIYIKMKNELIFSTDYGKRKDILIDASVKKIEAYKRVTGLLKPRLLEHQLQPFNSYNTYKLKSIRDSNFKADQFSSEVVSFRGGGYTSQYVRFDKELFQIIRILKKTKPSFLKRHAKEIFTYHRNQDNEVFYSHYLRISETLWSFIKQEYQLESKYIDSLFVETEENIRRKQEEIDDLYKLVLPMLHDTK